MAPKILLTGISGYIGGHTLKHIVEQHPDYQITAVVRNKAQAGEISTSYPKVDFVYGELDSHDVLVKAASGADVILQLASSDHIPAVKALIEGAAQHTGGPAYVLHIGGTGILATLTDPNGPGTANPEKIYSDIKDIDEITSFDPTAHFHADVDKAVLESGEKYNVPTAIICAPLIHGVGEGPIKKRSIQIPVYIDAVIKHKKAFMIDQGELKWGATHISDVADAFIFLTEQALKKNSMASWGRQGYYFVDSEEFRWKDVQEKIAEVMFRKGLIESNEMESVDRATAAGFHPWGPILWGSAARSRAERLRKLGWKTKGPKVAESVVSMVDFEVRAT